MLYHNKMRMSLVSGEFSATARVVCEYSNHGRTCCQENSHMRACPVSFSRMAFMFRRTVV